MGFLKSLFGGKPDESKTNISIHANVQSNAQGKKVGEKIQDLIILSIAERYKVGETKYPEYFRSRYGVGFPNEKFKALEQKGYIRPATALESLIHMKATELKTIANQFGLKTSGKKDDLCTRIAENVSEEDLQGCVPERYWIITESGRAVLAQSPYINFYLEKHPYSLENIGLDLDAYSKLFSGKSNVRVRDVLWGEFNRRSIDYYKKGMTKGEFRDYCELLRTMALFLEEENRHKDALAMYLRYIHYRANFDAALGAIRHYSVVKKIDDAADILFMNAEIYPFIADEILAMSNGCNFDSGQLRTFMKDTFAKEQDTGVFAPTELTEFIMCGLNGDQNGQKKICKNAMRAATKKLPKKK